MSVSINRNQIYLGESLSLSVKVSGSTDCPSPDLSALSDCSVKLLGSFPESRSMTTIINGVMTQERFVGRTFSYEITPGKAGKFVAGPIKLKVNGKTISAAGQEVEVLGVEAQNLVLVSVTSSRESALVDEPFDVTLSIALKRLNAQYADADPMDPAEPPALTVPFLDLGGMQGLDVPDAKQFLQQHLVRSGGPGFSINGHTVQADSSPFGPGFPFGFRSEAQTARFAFDRRVMETNGQSYLEYTAKLAYVPREEGSYTFGPVLFKGKTVTEVDGQGRGVKRNFFAVGAACTVRVVPPPEQGRPPSYIGAIGTNLVVESSLDAQTCNVGDPLTLTLSVSGSVSLDNIYPPALSEQADLTRSFKVYDDTVQAIRKEKARQYTWTIRPVKDGTIDLPPIGVSYYDSISRSYRTVFTKPIPVRVNKTKTVGSEIIISKAASRIGQGAAVEEMLIPAPLDMNPAGAEPASLLGPKWQLVPLAAAPVCYVLALSFVLVRGHLEKNSAAFRRRRALANALALAREAGGRAAGNDAPAARRLICAAVRRYLADRFGVNDAGLTPGDVRRILTEAGIGEDMVQSLCGIMERSFNAEFDQAVMGGSETASDCDKLREILARIDAADGKHGQTRTANE